MIEQAPISVDDERNCRRAIKYFDIEHN